MTWTHDVVVIGAGAAGLTVAGGLGRLGLAVALVEADRMGGECLNSGCVPSKALIACARRAQAVRDAGRFGVRVAAPEIDWGSVRAHVRGAVAAIAPHDAAERFEAWGVDVVRGHARFVAPRGLDVAGRRLGAPRIVLATGSRPGLPPLDGLTAVPYLTNETLFDLDERPRRLLVLGGGPIGCEMAQAFQRLGSDVALVEMERLLPGSDAEAGTIVATRLRAEGVAVFEAARAVGVEGRAGAIRLTLADGQALDGSHLLVATGRVANVGTLCLDVPGVTVGDDGIIVDRHGRTSARGIYAIGDCRAGPRFTHAAAHEGARLVTRLGFGVPAPTDRAALPRVTYTDPAVAEVGVGEAEARLTPGRVAVSREPFADNDRAVADGDTAGFAKVVRRDGRPVGAAIVGAGADELLLPWTLAVGRTRPTLWALSGLMLPYPTRGEIAKAVAFAAFEPRIFSARARAWAATLARLRRLGL